MLDVEPQRVPYSAKGTGPEALIKAVQAQLRIQAERTTELSKRILVPVGLLARPIRKLLETLGSLPTSAIAEASARHSRRSASSISPASCPDAADDDTDTVGAGCLA